MRVNAGQSHKAEFVGVALRYIDPPGANPVSDQP